MKPFLRPAKSDPTEPRTEAPQDCRMAEVADLIRERRRRRLEAEGLQFQEPPPSPPQYDGRSFEHRRDNPAGSEQRVMEAPAPAQLH
jgi:hypothetical protein